MLVERDRIDELCSTCWGAGWFWEAVLQSTCCTPFTEPDVPSKDDQTFGKVKTHCSACDGEGWVTPKDGQRVSIYRGNFLVGTCTVPATIKPHMFVEKRPGDYIPNHRGTPIYEMHRSVCPGDWEQLKGFQSA